jgi:hypothetical protein
MNLDPGAPLYADTHQIVQTNRLIHRQQLVITIWPRRSNPQAQIDFRERS